MRNTTTRRTFLKAASAGAVLSMTAATRARAAGANDRISVGLVGCGQRGGAHMAGLRVHAEQEGVDVTAVCDPWRERREGMAARLKGWYGREPRQFASYRELLACQDLDAVMIASCDHQHTTHLKAAAEAKKDVYCEKPLAMDLQKLKAARDAVRDNDVIVQIGTQLRSLPGMTGVRDLHSAGVLGRVTRVEQTWNAARPYWYSRLADVREADVDWGEFLTDHPKRAFDPAAYSGWYGYREFSGGAVPGIGSHLVDLVHYITGATLPESAICVGGSYLWNDEHHFTCPDHVQAVWTYPEGFMVSCSINFGNSGASALKIMGERGTVDLLPWSAPTLSAEGLGEARRVAHVDTPDHFLNWLQCVRDRKTPNASIDAGYQHAVAVIMATKAFDTGRKQVYDPVAYEIHQA